MKTWEVDIKGKPYESFEITVLTSDNAHGKRSYGWCGDNKLYVSGSGGPCHDTVNPFVFKRLVKIAQELADELNKGVIDVELIKPKQLQN